MDVRSFRVKWICLGLFAGLVFSTQSDEIVLHGGDVIHGKIKEQTEKHLVVEHPDLGTFEIPLQRVLSFSIAPKEVTDKTAQEAVKTVESDKAVDDEIPETIWYMPEFKRMNNWAAKMKENGFRISLDLSLDGSWGNTDEQALRLGTTIRRELEDRRWKMDLKYYNKTKKGSTSDNKLSTGVRRDWLNLGSRWFYFYEGRYDFDEFESWQHRASIHGGPGYALVDTRRVKLNALTGPGAKKEWDSQNDDLYIEGITGLDLEWKITQRQTLTAFTAYYPVITDFNDYRTRSNLNWRFLLDQELNLGFLLGVEHEYINVIDSDSKHNDTRVFMGIRYDF